MKQPNPQAEEAQVKAIFGPENQFVNWVGTLQFFCLPDNRRSALHSRLRRQPRALSLAAASSSNIRATVTAQVVPFSGLTKLNNILRAVNRPPTTGRTRGRACRVSLVSLLFFELLVDLRCSRLFPTSARTSPQPRLRSFFRGRRALPRREVPQA